MTKTDNTVRIILYLIAAGILIALFTTSCNGCKRPVEPIKNVVEVIEQSHNPAIDSLKQVTALLNDSILNLNKELDKQKNKTAIAESKATSTSNKLQDAINKKDTVEIIVYAQDVIDELYYYRQETIKQDSIQDAIIEKQAATLINNQSEIDLHESKYNQLKIAYNIQEVHLSDAARANEKLQKKLKRSKFFNKVLGVGTAAGAVLAGIMFL
jgi:hypothetical protein